MSRFPDWFEPPKSNSRALLVLGLFGFLISFLGTWALPLIDRDEPRFAEASWEMIERGDYLIPHFNGQHRFDKPPLIYWLQAPAIALFGRNETAVRLPSVLCATATALLIFGFGTRLFDRRTGWMAAFIFLTSLQVLVHAKAAVADFAMIFFMTAAFWAGWEMLRSPGKITGVSWWQWVFYISLGLGFLAKGPVAWFPIAVVAWRWFSMPRKERPSMGWSLGILLTLSIVAAWGLPALAATDGEFYRQGIGKHVVERSFTAMEGHGAKSLWVYLLLLPFYFVLVFFSFFPWSIRLPWLVKDLKTRGWRSDQTLYLLGGILLTFGIFTLVKTRLPHYTLPCFPLLALLLASRLSTAPEPVRGDTFFRRSVTGMAIVALVLAFVIFPLITPLFPSKKLWKAARADLKPEMEFASHEFNEPSLVWYFRNDVTGYHRLLRRGYMDLEGPRFCVLPESKIEKFFPEGMGEMKMHRVTGMNFAKFQPVTLVLVIKSE